MPVMALTLSLGLMSIGPMFDNIICLGPHWVCLLDEAYRGNYLAYAGNGTHSVTGAEKYWSKHYLR